MYSVSGRIVAIFTAAESRAPMLEVPEALFEPGVGIVGDRYARGTGTFSAKLAGSPDREITLIEAEQLERFNAEHGLALGFGSPRRNIVTRGIDLNALVGRFFQVGGAILEGLRLCEPCAHLAAVVSPKVLPGLVHRAGLRARIIDGGLVRPGDEIAPGPPDASGAPARP